MVKERTRTVHPLLERIRERGYWQVTIHPGKFESALIPYEELGPFVERQTVRIRGWDFPHTEIGAELRGDDWVGQATARYYLEYWRMYQSGQFVDYQGLDVDWRDTSQDLDTSTAWQPGQHLSVEDTVATLIEMLEFAARLALTDPYGISADMRIAILLQGVKGRTLFMQSERRLHNIYTATIDTLSWDFSGPRTELIADARGLAIAAAKHIFVRFGFDARKDVLREVQTRVFRS